MLSKILHTGDARAAERYVFRPVANTNPVTRRGAANPAQGRRADDARETQDAGPLHERIAELERQLAQQAATIRKDALREGEAQGRARAEAELKPIAEKMGQTMRQILNADCARRRSNFIHWLERTPAEPCTPQTGHGYHKGHEANQKGLQ